MIRLERRQTDRQIEKDTDRQTDRHRQTAKLAPASHAHSQRHAQTNGGTDFMLNPTSWRPAELIADGVGPSDLTRNPSLFKKCGNEIMYFAAQSFLKHFTASKAPANIWKQVPS